MRCKLISLLSFAAAVCAELPCHAADSAPAPRVVKIRAGVENAMKFDVGTITAVPGETIKVVLANASTLPKDVMGHIWVLLPAGSDPVAFAAAGAAEPKN